MKRDYFVVCAVILAWVFNLIATGTSFAQDKLVSLGVNFTIKSDTLQVRTYRPVKTDTVSELRTLVLKLNYAGSEIVNPEDVSALGAGCNVVSVDLVYTDFQEKDTEMLLNRKRFTELYFLCPDVFKQTMVDWTCIKQLGYSTEAEARKLFHGFVIRYYRLPPMKSFAASQLDAVRDTSLFSALRKANMAPTDLIAVDLTGSMSPYAAQIFKWLALNASKDSLSFVFFNDGDAKPDVQKRTGNTGGLYFKRHVQLDSILVAANQCTSGGFGGDTPENNVEAILKGLKKYKDSKRVVMVADNWAPMRDYSLITDVKKPVRIILCGTRWGDLRYPVNPQYLDLAKATGGSLHTMEEDLDNLSKVREGDSLEIGGFVYVIKAGQFVLKGPKTTPAKTTKM